MTIPLQTLSPHTCPQHGHAVFVGLTWTRYSRGFHVSRVRARSEPSTPLGIASRFPHSDSRAQPSGSRQVLGFVASRLCCSVHRPIEWLVSTARVIPRRLPVSASQAQYSLCTGSGLLRHSLPRHPTPPFQLGAGQPHGMKLYSVRHSGRLTSQPAGSHAVGSLSGETGAPGIPSRSSTALDARAAALRGGGRSAPLTLGCPDRAAWSPALSHRMDERSACP